MARTFEVDRPTEESEEFPQSGNTPDEFPADSEGAGREDDEQESTADYDGVLAEAIAVSDPAHLRELLATSMQLEAKTLRRLMSFVGRIEPRLTRLQEEYANHRDRTARLYSLATRGLVRIS